MKFSSATTLTLVAASSAATIIEKRNAPSSCSDGIYICCAGGPSISSNNGVVTASCDGKPISNIPSGPADHNCNTGGQSCTKPQDQWPYAFVADASTTTSQPAPPPAAAAVAAPAPPAPAAPASGGKKDCNAPGVNWAHCTMCNGMPESTWPMIGCS